MKRPECRAGPLGFPISWLPWWNERPSLLTDGLWGLGMQTFIVGHVQMCVCVRLRYRWTVPVQKVQIKTKVLFYPTGWALWECDSLCSTRWLKQNYDLDLYFPKLNFPPLVNRLIAYVCASDCFYAREETFDRKIQSAWELCIVIAGGQKQDDVADQC